MWDYMCIPCSDTGYTWDSVEQVCVAPIVEEEVIAPVTCVPRKAQRQLITH